MELVDYRTEGAVAVITLQRPPVNALNPELIADIDTAVGLAESPEVRAVVITGSPHFAAGADITGFQRAFESGAEERQATGLLLLLLLLALLLLPGP